MSETGIAAPGGAGGGQTMASIVVCMYNRVNETDRCLSSIACHTAAGSYEVILVDDGSTEGGVEEMAARHPHVTLVRSPANEGFTKAANRGAARARGRYLVFLNNDTEVTADWLESLLDAAGSGPDVAIVGARLVYPDGTLQEAGGVIWEDGTGVNFGKWQDPSRSEFAYRREVDYCSGAALLVERRFFESVGGFDERFAPGYYEDTDLCFAARAAGRTVLYEPGSRVVHLEGATFGTEAASGSSTVFTKASQEINRHRFRAKWADELLKHYPPGTAGGLLGGRVRGRPRVLVAETQVPAHDRDSGGKRLDSMLRILHGLGCEVTFVPADRYDRRPYSERLRRAGIEVHCDAVPLEELGRQRQGLYDLVILSKPDPFMQLHGTCRRFFPSAPIVYDTVDLQFIREERRIALLDPTERMEALLHAQLQMRRRECDYARAADVVAVVTEVEGETLRGLIPGAEVIVLPNVHEPIDEPVPGFDDRSGLLFIGGYGHPPNLDGVGWYLDEVCPLLERRHTLVALGSDPPPELLARSSDDLVVPGFLPDVTEYFRRSTVFVSPLRYGAGMKGKVGQAMSLGLPVVTTSIGAEGMGLVDGVHALIADTSAGFAEAIERLHQDRQLWESLSLNAITKVRTEWAPDAMASRLQGVLDYCGLARRLRPRSWGLTAPR